MEKIKRIRQKTVGNNNPASDKSHGARYKVGAGVSTVNHYETFMQRVVALIVAAEYLGKACPKEYVKCMNAIRLAQETLEPFRNMSPAKKWAFNRLYSSE